MFKLESFFPEEIGDVRDSQKEIMDMLDAELAKESKTQRVFLIDAPVGVGKSAVVASLLRYYEYEGVRSIVLTPLKCLQDQYAETFPDIPNIKGRANYTCSMSMRAREAEAKRKGISLTALLEDKPVDNAGNARCKSTKVRCALSRETPCDYYEARDRAMSSPYFVTNFRYFFLAKNFLIGQDTGKRILIIDEAHTIADELLTVLTIKLDSKVVGDIPKYETALKYKSFLESKLDSLSSSIDQATQVVTSLIRSSIKGISQETLDEILDDLTGNGDVDLKMLFGKQKSKKGGESSLSEHLEAIINIPGMQSTLERFVGYVTTHTGVKKVLSNLGSSQKMNWVVKHTTTRDNRKVLCVEFTPVDLGQFCQSKLFDGFDEVFLLSGTVLVPDVFARELGITNYVYIPVKHPFPVDNRLIYLPSDKMVNMSYKNEANNVGALVDQLAHLFTCYPDKRGIVFTVSGRLQNRLVTEFEKRYPELAVRITSAEPHNKESQLAYHCSDAATNSVLFTTSMWQGVDLKDDLSRFQVFPKVPFQPLVGRTAVMKDQDTRWYLMQTAKIMSQGYGRSIRTPLDHAHTWILDSNIFRVVSTAGILPVWFTEALRRV